jgi:uroporphyrinogen decarboxylase
MNSQQRITAALTGARPDRVPYQDAFWQTTIQRWHAEGLPDHISPDDYFGCEMVGISGSYTLQLPLRVLDETERDRTYVDADGATRRELNTGDGWTPHWLDFTINSAEAWRRHRHRGTYDPGRLADDLAARYRRARELGRFVVYRAHGCFHPTWHKMGLERMLIAMIEEPDWIHDMYDVHTQLIIDLYDGCRERGVVFDAAWLADDLGYRTAPLIAPSMYCDLVGPHHQRACQHFAADGIQTMLHSDGDVRTLIPHFLEAGFSCLHPLEAKAGLDVAALKAEYGSSLVCFGNIDARRLAGSKSEIQEEVHSKVEAGKKDGGYIFHTDHSVPNDVSFENYCYALNMLEKYGHYA